MENAVQALLIAAGVLVGVMILSLAVSLYSSLGVYIEQTEQDIIDKQVQQFNEQFLKYVNCNDAFSDEDFTLTIQDVVTAANAAYENNQKYELTEYTGHNYYVTVNLNGTSIEKTINDKSSEILANGLGVQYRCSRVDIKIDSISRRVYEVNFITK